MHNSTVSTLDTCRPRLQPTQRKWFFSDRDNIAEYLHGILSALELIYAAVGSGRTWPADVALNGAGGPDGGARTGRSRRDVCRALQGISGVRNKRAARSHQPTRVNGTDDPLTQPSNLAELVSVCLEQDPNKKRQRWTSVFVANSVFGWTAARVGLGRSAGGVFTRNNAHSNLMAVSLARAAAGVIRQGEVRGFRVLASQASRFSVCETAAMLGYACNTVIPVACDEHFEMDPLALTAEIAQCHAHNLIPIAVVATVGTAASGRCDPIREIADTCREHGIWLHVDASRRWRSLLGVWEGYDADGIKYADSLALDYRESPVLPLKCGALLVRERRHLRPRARG